MKHNGHPVDLLTDIKSLTDVLKPPAPQHMGCPPTAHAITPRTYRHAREHIMYGGVGHMGRHPNTWGCPNKRRAPCIHYHMQIPPTTYTYTGEHWRHMGALGYPNIWGFQTYGASELWGVYRCTPSVKHTCL